MGKPLTALRYAPQQPFLATSYGVVAPTFTSLSIQASPLSSTRKIYDSATSDLVMTMHSPTFSSRRTLTTPDGRALASLKSRTFSSSYRVYEGADKSTVVFDIDVKSSAFSTAAIHATFHDRVSGELVRALIEGDAADRVAVVYLERGPSVRGPLPKSGEKSGNTKRFQAIGRIRRPRAGVFDDEEYFVEAALGADITLLLLLWRVRHDNLERTRRLQHNAS